MEKSVLTVIHNGETVKYLFEYNPQLLEFLDWQGYDVPHACGGNGICGTCSLLVNGQLLPACQVRIRDGMVVEFPGGVNNAIGTIHDKL